MAAHRTATLYLSLFMAIRLSGASEPVAYWPTGMDACPCINPWKAPFSLQVGPHGPSVAAAGPMCAIVRASDGFCFPPTYGVPNDEANCSRADWGVDSANCNSANVYNPAWCSSMWCYIDPSDCLRPSEPSAYFPGSWFMSSNNHSSPLHFSYQTCGYVDSFSLSTNSAAQELRTHAARNPSGKMRVGFPGDSSTGYTIVGKKPFSDGTLKVAPGSGVGGTDRSGSVLVLMDNLMQKLRVPWEEIAVSDRSKGYSPSSSFTACVHDVAIGNVDMCWGNFWPTASRRQIASFTGALYLDSFYVIVHQSTRTLSFTDAIVQPFAPFTPSLWALLFTTLGVVGISLVWSSKTEETTFCDMLPQMAGAFVRGWHGFSTGEIKQVVVRSTGGWLTQFFVGFTKTVFIAGYTALTVSTLLKQQGAAVNSFNEAIEARYRFCANPDIIPAVAAQFPAAAEYLVGVPKAEVLDRMDRGECEAGILNEDEWRNLRLWGETHHCDSKVRLPNVLVTVPNAIVVSESISKVLGWAVRAEIEAGNYNAFKTIALRNYTANLCPEASATTHKAKLGVSDLGAPLLMLFLAAMMALVLSRVGMVMDAKADRAKKAFDKDGDGRLTTAEFVRSMTKKVSTPSSALSASMSA